jgi:DNA-binding transcriptional MocR family regulator
MAQKGFAKMLTTTNEKAEGKMKMTDRASDAPTRDPPWSHLHRNVAAKLGSMIEQGLYRPGERLPSIRELSRRLRVGINTVTQAYIDLENARLVEARPQSGYYVSCHAQAIEKPREPSATGSSPTARTVTLGDTHLQIMRDLNDERLVPLGRGAPSTDILPAGKLNRMLAAQGRRFPSAYVSYAAPNGIARLRTQIARRSLDYGCALAADQVVVTSGCVEAVTLALQAICRAGDTVVVESPVYYTFLKSIQWMGLKVLEIPATAREGMSLEVLHYVLRQNDVRACVVISNYNNPLGSLMPDDKKRELVRLLARFGVPLIEDDVYGDLGFGNTRPCVFKAFDDQDLVLLCSSFSKTLAPGYRVGWIAPGRFLQKVDGLKSLFNIAAATPTQFAVAEFLADGGYDRHLRAARRTLAQRMEQMRQTVFRHFPSGTQATDPAGGCFLWVEMPEEIDALRLHQEALGEGIGVAPGTLFTLGDRFRNCIRLNGSFWSERIERAVATLGRLAGSQQRAAKGRKYQRSRRTDTVA